MSVELLPLGVSCNSACSYCYQEPIRDAGNTSKHGLHSYDIDKMIEKGLSLGSHLVAYGGEALLIPIADLEKIYKASFEKYGSAGTQTNGDLITDAHIELFKKYNVGIGVSIDGPGVLNMLRPRRSDGNYIIPTQNTMANLVKLREAGVRVSVISTLTKANAATDATLNVFKEWGLWLASIGITSVNIHLMESESPALKRLYGFADPKQEECIMRDLAEWLEQHPHLQWQPFRNMKELLQFDNSNASCIWHHCDPLTTPAVQGVIGDGTMTNCGRIAAKDGIQWLKPKQAGYERYISLYQTPEEYGGCKGCRFFLVCGGECPGTGFGEDGPDWRLKTDHCETLKGLFEFYEVTSKSRPLSKSNQREDMETITMQMFAEGKRPQSLVWLRDEAVANPPVKNAGNRPHGDEHGDHFDHANRKSKSTAPQQIKKWQEFYDERNHTDSPDNLEGSAAVTESGQQGHKDILVIDDATRFRR